MELEYVTYRLRKLLDAGVIRKIEKLSDDSRYEPGRYYWCGYWSKWYKVEQAVYGLEGFLKYVVVTWEDGRRGEHCTPLDKRKDFLITLNNERVKT